MARGLLREGRVAPPLTIVAGTGEAAPHGMLDLSDVAHYLLSLGLVKASAVVEEDFAVADVSRRNRVFVATGPGDCVHVVKQAVGRSAATLAHEAAVLRSLSDVPELAGR